MKHVCTILVLSMTETHQLPQNRFSFINSVLGDRLPYTLKPHLHEQHLKVDIGVSLLATKNDPTPGFYSTHANLITYSVKERIHAPTLEGVHVILDNRNSQAATEADDLNAQRCVEAVMCHLFGIEGYQATCVEAMLTGYLYHYHHVSGESLWSRLLNPTHA